MLIGVLGSCGGRKSRTSIISRFIRDGPNGNSKQLAIFENLGSLHQDMTIILKLLILKSSYRKLNLQDKQLIKYLLSLFIAMYAGRRWHDSTPLPKKAWWFDH